MCSATDQEHLSRVNELVNGMHAVYGITECDFLSIAAVIAYVFNGSVQ